MQFPKYNAYAYAFLHCEIFLLGVVSRLRDHILETLDYTFA
jgi:hypothetical protein